MNVEGSVDSVGEGRLDQLLGRVAYVAPRQMESARSEMVCTLAAVRGSALGDAAWRASRLTPSRYPVEVAVTSASDELRTVVEVIAPEGDPARAFGNALTLAEYHGAQPLDRRRRIELAAHQRTVKLRFGAWLGSRHRRDSTRHKVYVEVADDVCSAWSLLDLVVPEARRLLGGLGRPRFVGIPLDGSHAMEVYVRPRNLDDMGIAMCLGRAGLGHMTDAVLSAMLGDITAPAGGRLRGRNHGLSVSVLDGRCVAVAVFTFAHDRYRMDHRTRQQTLALAEAQQWPSRDIYGASTHGLEVAQPLFRPLHTTLTEVVQVNSEFVEHHVGFTPPPSLQAARPAVYERQPRPRNELRGAMQ